MPLRPGCFYPLSGKFFFDSRGHAFQFLLCRTQRPEDDAAVAVDYEGARDALLRIKTEYPFVRIHCRQVAQISVIMLFVACEKLVEALFRIGIGDRQEYEFCVRQTVRE